jgi:Raf kinase inhibitor-like YbhB/YbcL family protein
MEIDMQRFVVWPAVVGLAVAGFVGFANAQDNAIPKTVYDNVATSDTPQLTLTSSAITAGQPISDDYTQNGANKSPPLTWTAGPASTKAYVVVLQDPIAGRPMPAQHWIIFNIPADTTSLPEDVAKTANPDTPKGAVQATAGKATGFRGPKPPAGQTHTYVFQVFAIDQPLSVDAATVNAASLADAMKGRVVAAGELKAPYTGK